MLSFKKCLSLTLIGLSSASMYTLVYVRYYFYDDWLASLNVGHGKAALLYAAYAVGCTIGYLPGGWIADHYSVKRIFTISLAITAGLNFLFAFTQNYYVALLIWFALAVTSGFGFWAGLIKAVRLTASPSEQGRAYGIFGASEGLCTSLIMSIGLWLYTHLGQGQNGFRGVIISYAVFCLITIALINFIYKDPNNNRSDAENNKIKLPDFKRLLQTPTIWVLSVMIFCTYGLFNSTSYLTPYLTNVLGASTAYGGVIAVVRLQLFAFLIGPLAGYLADRIGAPSKLVASGHICVMILLFVLMSLPLDRSAIALAIAVILAISAVLFSFYLIMFSVIEEMGFPRRLTGTVVGVVSMIGYSPDLFFSPIFGYWLDNYGNSGYHYIFTFLMANGIVGSACALWLCYKGRKLLMRQKKIFYI